MTADTDYTAIDLWATEPLGDAARIRIADVLHGPSWGWLTVAVRAAWEQDLTRRRVHIELAQLSGNEASALADFLNWPTNRTGVANVDLARLDAMLRASGLQAGLATCLTVAGGPLDDQAGRRRAEIATRTAEARRIWAEANDHPAIARRPELQAWLTDEHRTGKLPANLAMRRRHLNDVLAVLGALPDPGIARARLANRILGDAHALDAGPVPAAILRGLARLAGLPQVPPDATGRRELWASVGVALDAVSSTVLVYGLTLPGDGPVPTTLAVNAAAGLPVRLTLGQLRHHLNPCHAHPPAIRQIVFACENPSVVEVAADQLGPASHPLVCVEGQPSVAALLLLSFLRQSSAEIRYHGDFDWPGVSIAAGLIAGGARPWRFTSDAYLAAVSLDEPRKALSTSTGPAKAPWDEQLVPAMLRHRVAIEEESVANHLIADLARR